MGRMCTIMKKQKVTENTSKLFRVFVLSFFWLTPRVQASLEYLEQVRQHMARLPSIDPSARTLLLTGYPNVGKSSFMNTVTRADVEVQPYAFTTKSLFVGHTDYKYLTWQVIDTPGILDHPLEERNVIEMQSITALAHLRAAILYLIDISEQCGYTIEQQVSLFNSIKPLFANKPLIIVANKIDVMPFDALSNEKRSLIEGLKADGVELIVMSTLTEEGVHDVKSIACERLLHHRIQTKLKTKNSLNLATVHLSTPKPRDERDRPAFIPDGFQFADQRAANDTHDMDVDDDDDGGDDGRAHSHANVKLTKAQLELLRQEEDELLLAQGIVPYMGDQSEKDRYLLANDEWRYDKVPEIMDGKNLMDFIDPDILRRLEELEREEEELLRLEQAEQEERDESDSDLDEEEEELLSRLRKKKVMLKKQHEMKRGANRSTLPRKDKIASRSSNALKEHLLELGVDQETVEKVGESRESRARSKSRSRSRGKSIERKERQAPERTPLERGFADDEQKRVAEKMARRSRVKLNLMGRAGESDRHVHEKKPKHLFTGKRGIGKTDRR